MLDNLLPNTNDQIIEYPILDSKLPFAEYIAQSRAIIANRRTDLAQSGSKAKLIIDTNSPFELYPDNAPTSGKRLRYGALLIHGLLDCPFSLKDVGLYLQKNGILSRAILLPGHGTRPSDLLYISYHDWIQAVRYGIETLREEVDQIFLIGYSTGAALSFYHALQDSNIAGMIMVSPAIKIKLPINVVVGWRSLTSMFRDNRQWANFREEIDYAKYTSSTFNSKRQVTLLTEVIRELSIYHRLAPPVLMVMSREDETISSTTAINFFSQLKNPDNRLLLYTSRDQTYKDARISTRLTHFPELNIKCLSHNSLTFTANNFHYGQHGDYKYASHINETDVIFGAYNQLQEDGFDLLNSMGLTKVRRDLTYNPDFDFMAERILNFILSK